MVISYIHSICWRMKSVFYECQQRAGEVVEVGHRHVELDHAPV
jgi:hypothetical protein